MQTFKKIVGFIIVNFIVVALASFSFAQPSVLKILLKDAKNTEYNTIILGQSHGTTSFDPFVMSDETGEDVFNLSRRLMPVVDLQYVLEEANVNDNYKRVILDIDPSYWDTDHSGNAGNDTNLLMRLSGSRRVDYIKNILLDDNYNESFADYNVSIDTIKRISKVLKSKLNKDYFMGKDSSIQKMYSLMGMNECYEYKGRGFRYGIKQSGVNWEWKDFNAKKIKDENLKAFENIVDYCEKNNIELICVQSALPPSRLKNENMDDVHEYFTKLCDKYGVPFYDLNYLKSDYLSRTDDDYVDIDGHMMGELADKQSVVLSRLLLDNNKSRYFYDDYDEVLEHLD